MLLEAALDPLCQSDPMESCEGSLVEENSINVFLYLYNAVFLATSTFLSAQSS